MLFRAFVFGVVIVGAALGWIMAAGPSFTLGLVKDDLVGAYEKAGVDMSQCKARWRTPVDPGGGVQQCTEEAFRDIEKKLRAGKGDGPSFSVREAPYYDAPAEAPSADEQAEAPSEE